MSFQLLTDASALKESPAGADGDGNSDSNGGGGRHSRDRLAKDMAPHESPRQIGKAPPDTMHFGMKDTLQFRDPCQGFAKPPRTTALCDAWGEVGGRPSGKACGRCRVRRGNTPI